MKNENIIVEEVIYGFTGESTSFYGYFESVAQAAKWIQTGCSDCEIVEENTEYQYSECDGGVTWIIHDTKDEKFKQHCAIMRAGDLPCFNEDDMFVVD